MKQIALLFIFTSTVFILIMDFIKAKKRKSQEIEALTVLLYILLAQKDRDANNMLFNLEKYAKNNREFINDIRIGYLKNNITKYEDKKDKRVNTSFFEAAKILFENGNERAMEFLFGAGELKRNNQARIMKVRNEIVNSVGIILTMIIMFLVIIYFLSPYTKFFNTYNV